MTDSGTSERRKHAVVVGIDAFPNLSSLKQLQGCVNDAQVMAQVLRDAYGFEEENIALLTNEKATRDGILAALANLTARVERDDVVVFYFAGHGSQIRDREGDEPDGFDETLVPYDTARPPLPNRDITDDQIHAWLVEVTEKTPYVTLVIDCCHSGTMTRDAFGGRARSLEPDLRPVEELPPSPVQHSTRSAGTREGASGWLPLGEKYVLVAGCRDDELSYEYMDPESGAAHGALTYFLSRHLAQAAPGTTYRDVFESVRAQVTAYSSKQHPQMEGALDREVFGVRDVPPVRFVQVGARAGENVELLAGAAQGVTRGSAYDVYPGGTKRPDDGQTPLGRVEVTRVGALTSTAKVLEETEQNAVSESTRAFERTHGAGLRPLTVAFTPPEAQPDESAAFLARLGTSNLVEHAEAERAEFRAYLLPARSAVAAADPVEQAGPLTEPTWAVVGADGRLAMPLHAAREVGVADVLVSNFETLARYRQALTLDNPLSSLKGTIDVRLRRLGPDGAWGDADPDPASGEIVFTEGDRLAITVSNNHTAPVYIYALDFGLTGRIGLLTIAGANEALAPGNTQEVGVRSTIRVGMPRDFPFVEQPGEAPPAEGVETLRVFVTTEPTDFSSLMQQGVRSVEGGVGTSLGRLLRQTFAGTTRELFEEPENVDADWTVVTRPFTLRQKT